MPTARDITTHNVTDAIDCEHNVVVAIGLDRFNFLGRVVGERDALAVLKRTASALRTHLGDATNIRLHQAAVTFVLPKTSLATARQAIEICLSQLPPTVDFDGYAFEAKFRAGVALQPPHIHAHDAIERALVALRGAQARREILAVADTYQHAATAYADDLALLRAIQQAIGDDRLILHYQPKICARTGATNSVEALLRWNDPERGFVSPDTFIPLVEESGDIRPLTEWIIGRAIADQAALLKSRHRVSVHINISSTLLGDRGYAWSLMQLCTALQGDLGFEVTETAMMIDPEMALANLGIWADAGIRLAIDDYGSGFSSLAYLQRLPVHELKLDRSFIARLSTSNRDPLLVRSTIDLAHALDLKVTAEGVDTPEAMALLQVMGCDFLQGYFLSKPLPLADLVKFLDQRNGAAATPVAQGGAAERLRRRLADRA